MFQDSKIPMLMWVRAIYFVMQSKRGISALELKRLLAMKSYGTAWTILHKIRRALIARDSQYKLKDIVELDGTCFGRRSTNNQARVLIAVENRQWADKKRNEVGSKAGFAKVIVAPETRVEIETMMLTKIEPGATIYTDGSSTTKGLKGPDYRVSSHVTQYDKSQNDRWLPWVHRFISNAKAWILGTHHGVERKYLALYLGEYTYRFNRRHDQDGLFHRALFACVTAPPTTSYALLG